MMESMQSTLNEVPPSKTQNFSTYRDASHMSKSPKSSESFKTQHFSTFLDISRYFSTPRTLAVGYTGKKIQNQRTIFYSVPLSIWNFNPKKKVKNIDLKKSCAFSVS